ncbi:Cytokinin hydroxylase [Leucoagaricus sp. SymC.cos]|nr:Cytokinin hydroxylase [Leucoagaricus sp. SymC.cos]
MESLHDFPPAPVTYRQAAESDLIDGAFIPKGTIIYIPIRVINTWEEFWGPDAEEFRPECWLDSQVNADTRFKFATFSTGIRECTGRTVALLQMKLVIAALVTNFRFDLAYEGQVPQPGTGITMRPRNDLPLRVRQVR